MNTPKNSKSELSGVYILILDGLAITAKNHMTYQMHIIKDCIKDRLRRLGIDLSGDSVLTEMIATKIRRLNVGDYVAIEIDDLGALIKVEKIDGFDSLHRIRPNAVILSFHDFERYFNEQHSVSV